MKAILVSIFISLVSVSSFAEGIYPLGDEANQALRHLSYCADAMAEMVTPGRWIGRASRWDSRSQNYGYDYFVFERTGFVTSKMVGKLAMTAREVSGNIPDRPGYYFHCEAVYDNRLD